jgi:hypothetical protein
MEWQITRLSGGDGLAVRASKKLRSDELLITSFAATRLRMELDKVPLWRGNHVAIKQLVEDFAKYLYLPRLKDPSVLMAAVASGIGLMSWEQESFAYAESYDESGNRYRGLQYGRPVHAPDANGPALLVKPSVARAQIEREKQEEPPKPPNKPGQVEPPELPRPPPPPQRVQPKRFHGTVTLDPTRVGRDASRVADEVITHLAGLVAANVRVTLEIQADIPGGAPENVVRTVTENSRTLKFTSQGFENE